MVRALRDLKIPPTKLSEEGEVQVLEDGKPYSLTVQDDLSSVTMVHVAGKLIVDPTEEEEDISECQVTCVFRRKTGAMVMLHKARGKGLDEKDLLEMTTLAEKLYKEE